MDKGSIKLFLCEFINNSFMKKMLTYVLAIFALLSLFIFKINDVLAVAVGDATNITTVGSSQRYTAPATGYYQLEVWGAQGGSSGGTGGYGAYATGIVKLEKAQVLFVTIGGAGGAYANQGSNESRYGTGGGGSNGGGNGNGYCGQGGGGGATHIATESGYLSSFSTKTDKLLIVASGGGGAYHWKNGNGSGNNGGGYATTAAGNTYSYGSFGQGGSGMGNRCGGGGGGGGYTGGNGGGNTGVGGGGSSYIANPLLLSRNGVTKAMYCTGCALNSGATTNTLQASGVNGTATAKYAKAGAGFARITVKELLNTNSKLSNITVSGGSFNKPFSPNVYEYDVVVDSENYQVDITGTPQDPTTTVSTNGSYNLKAGVNKITITGTAESGDTTVYTLNITRPASSYKYLSDIKINGGSIANFNPTTLTYTINASYEDNDLNIEAIPGRTDQTVYLPNDLSINSGSNIKEIIVISEDGQYTTTYTLNIIKRHTSYLKSLALGEFEIDFNPQVLEYTVNVLSSTLSIPVAAVPYDEEATIKTSGFGYIKGSGTATITVTEPNCSPTVYTFTIVKDNVSDVVPHYYSYTGGIQTFTAPYTGFYQLEVWGAQGGNVSNRGGFGAYATGAVKLKKDQVLYVYVGGQGGSYPNQGSNESRYGVGVGGFNGGGNGNGYCGQGGGGGATHIATEPGALSSFSGKLDKLLIAAGGGGGAYHWKYGGGNGAEAGGYARTYGPSSYAGGSFGQGGAGMGNRCGGGGGGGGYYGGNGGGNVAGGGGGSSYIGNQNLVSYKEITKAMYGYGAAASSDANNYTVTTYKYSNSPTSYYAKGGAGYAKITLLPQPSENNFLSSLTAKYKKDVRTYNPTFDMQVNDYYLTLPSTETELTVSARPEDSLATISGIGTYDIPAGTTDIDITVTAESGAERVYTLHVTRPADNNPYPLDIVINGLVPSLCGSSTTYCSLSPTEFDPYTYTYYLTVPSRIKQLYFAVDKGHKYQVVSGEGKATLEAGENIITIDVLSEDGLRNMTYTYYVTRDMTGNTDLSKLEIIDPPRNINYDPDILEYYLSIPNEYTKIEEYLIETEDPNASYVVVGNENFVSGLNKVSIIVTAANGDTTTYLLNVYREKSSNVFLENILVDNGTYPIIPDFNKFVMEYKTTVPNNITSVNVTGVPEDSTTSVSVSGPSTLATGNNTFTITTTAEDGSTEVYKVIVTREKNSNPNLISVVVNDGTKDYTLTPTFDKDTIDYTLDIDEGVTSISITATPEVSTTTYKLLDNNSIKIGENTKRVMGIAEDGTTKTYTIKITRSASTNNYLTDLTVVGSDDVTYTLTPAFDKDTQDYTLEVENEVTSVTVTGTKESNLATVKGNGKYSLVVGENYIQVSVTSEAGEMRSYNITITRKPSSNAYLSNITLDKGSITFDKETLKYVINVDNDVDKIKVTGTPEVRTTTVTGNNTYDLNVGSNTIKLITLAEDGVTTLTYELEVIRDKSGNANLASLIMEEGAIKPKFDKNTINYTAKVPMNIEHGTFHVTTEDPDATYSITGDTNFVVGNNTVTIVVTAANGDTKTYTVIVTRQEITSPYLLNLEVEGFQIEPTFEKEKFYYTLTVPYETESVFVKATLEDNDAEITGTGSHSLNVGDNTIVVEVTSLDGASTTYQIVITRKPSSDARIKALEIMGSILTPNFDKDILEYSLTTSSQYLDFSRIEMMDEMASYEIMNNWFDSVGSYDVIIRGWAADNETTKDYILHVEKTPSNNNNLSWLEVIDYQITPEFDPATTLYKLTVPKDINSVEILAFPEDWSSTVTGDGFQNLTVGENQLVIEVTSESGNKKSYVIVITKEGNDNNNAQNIIVNNGIMTPEFYVDTINYDVEVPYEEESLDLTVILEDENATYSVADNKLEVGVINKVKVIVTAENGSIKTYTLNVTRKDIVSSLLKDLKVKDYEITPNFNSNITDYDVTINFESDALDITAIPLDKNATIEITGNENLVVGANTIKIKVTASDNSSTTTYTLNVNKQPFANNYLDYLYTNLGDLTPIYNKTIHEYSINVPNNVSTIELIGEPVDKSATVTGLGEHNLVVGDNKIYVTVTSTSGVKRTYIVNVIRAKDSENYLESLKVKVGGTVYPLDPEFDKYTVYYNVSVPVGTTAVNLEGTYSPKATATGLGMRPLNIGHNALEVTITAEDGTANVYVIDVYRPASSNNFLIQINPSVGELDPEFDYYETNYTINLDSSASLLSFDVVTEDNSATVTGTESRVIPDGISTRTIIVTAEDGTPRTYTFTINKERADNAKLASLSVNGYPFVETFDPDVLEYHITVPNSKTVLMNSEVNATPQDKNATVTKQSTLAINTGSDNTYVVRVVAPDGFTSRDYKIIVTREKGNNTQLNSLVVNVGSLTSAFNPNVLEYTWLVPKNHPILTGVDVTATPADLNATVTKSSRVDAEAGEQYIVTVTSEDGKVSTEYVLNTQVMLSNDATLDTLSVDKGVMRPTFNPETLVYDVYEYVDVTDVNVSATVHEEDAKIVSGVGNVTLTGDLTVHKVVVEAEDGTKKTYTLNIHRTILTDEGLRNLGLNGLDAVVCKVGSCTLTPNFDTSTLIYNIAVPNDYEKLNILAEPMNSQQTIKYRIGDNYITNGTYELPVGSTTVIVEVYNGLDIKTREYSLTVFRNAKYDGRLASLDVDVGYYEPTFNLNTFTYDVYTYVDATSIDIDATLIDDTSTIESGVGTFPLNSDLSRHIITVRTFDNEIVTYELIIHRSILRDEGLKNLGLNGLETLNCSNGKCVLSPIFETNTLNYRITAPFEYTNLDVLAEPMNNQQTVKFKVDGNYIETYELPVGETTVLIEVYDGMGVNTRNYTLVVNRSKTSNTFLSSLNVTGTNGELTLKPTFNKNVYEYYVELTEDDLDDKDGVSITATTEDALAKLYINGYNYLEEGDNIAEVIVTAQDGTQQTTRVHLVLLSSDEPYLKNITVSTGSFWELEPTFRSTLYSYTTTVSGSFDKVTIEGIPLDSDTTTVSGDIGEQKVVTGSNKFVITATHLSGKTKTYVLEVIKLESREVDLKELSVGEGSIDPEFDATITKYSVDVEESVRSLTITAIPKDPNAEVIITGNNNLLSGNNTVNIIVVSSDKSASKTYQITVNKAVSSDSKLIDLKVYKDGVAQTLDPTFNPIKYSYDVVVDKDTDKVTIAATTNNMYATVSGTGLEYLAYGDNYKTVTVTAEDGSMSIYNINIYRSYNLDLIDIVSDIGTIEPAFDKDTTSYTLTLPTDTTKVSFIAFPESNKVTVQGNGTYELENTEVTVQFKVVAPDNKFKTYTVVVQREEDDNNYIKSLAIHEGGTSPSFDRETQEYEVHVRKDNTSITMDIELESDKATYQVMGNVDLQPGENTVTIRVTAENGDKRDYVVKVYLEEDEYFSNLLIDLSISEGKLNPDFDPYINYYATTVPNSVDSLVISAIKKSDKSVVSGTGLVNLNVGRNVFLVTVTSNDGKANIYTVVINRTSNNDATLQSLSIKDSFINPMFSKMTTSYKSVVSGDVTDLDITAIPTDKNSTVEITGDKGLVFGDNVVSIKVTAPDGVTTMTYTIVVNKEKSTNNYLSSLTVSGYNLDPEFVKTNNGPYTVEVPSNVNSIVVDGVPEVASTTVTGDGVITLGTGDNLVEVTATSEANEKRVYSIIIKKKLDDDNSLKNLLVSDGTLDPVFDPDTLSYTVQVDDVVSDVTVIGFVNKDTSTISGNGTYSLNKGSTSIPITVTAENGTSRVYTVNFIKDEDVDHSSKILDLIVKNGELNPHFNKNTINYTVKVPYEVTELDYIIKLESDKATYQVIGNENFVVGTNTVKFEVTNGDAKTTYNITVVRGPVASNYLTNLRVDGYSINPYFDKNTLYYTLEVPSDVEKVNVIATLEDASSTVTGDGEHSLVMGRNDIYVTVTSSSGVVRTYTICITRGEEDDKEDSAKILDLIVKNGELNPHFNKDTKEYTIKVPYEVTSLDYIVTLESDKATYKVNGNKNFVVGSNKVEFVVTNGTKKETYKLNVIRGEDANNYLTNLEVENQTMYPTFDKETLYYTVAVPYETNIVNVIATLEDVSSTVTGDGLHSLVVGRNDIYVTVTSSTGVVRTYTICITRADNEENKLLTLVSDIGEFDKTFSPIDNEYTLTVPAGTTKINLSGTYSPGATASGLGEVNITENKFDHKIIVTSASGAVNVYSIHIKRENSVNTELEYLIPSAGEMEYSNDITEYEFEVDDNVSTISFDYKLKDPKATITGVELTPLDYGENNIKIVVTAEDGIEERIINVKITRNKDIAEIIPDELNIVLLKDETKQVTYTLVPSDTTYTDVTFSIEDEDIATVDEDGNVTGVSDGSTVLTITSVKNPAITANVTINVLNTKITSQTLDILREVEENEGEEEEGEVHEYPPIVIGENPRTALSEFLTKFDNDESLLKVYDKDDNLIEDLDTFTGSFMKLKLVIFDEVYDELTVVVRGDFNGDGMINAIDTSTIINYIYERIEASYIYDKIGDVNGDNFVNAGDTSLIINYIYERIDTLNFELTSE